MSAMSATIPTPAPMPAFAPVERPVEVDDGVGVLLEEVVGAVEVAVLVDEVSAVWRTVLVWLRYEEGRM